MVRMKDAGNQSMFWAGFGTFWAAYSVEQKLAILGLVIGTISGFVNMYAKCQEGRSRKRREKQDAELHQMEMEKLRIEIARMKGDKNA